MTKPNTHRLDELPLDRRIAGEARGLVDGTRIGAIYERRDVDPVSPHFKRRHGSLRTTNIAPNLLGVAHNGDDGRVVVDRNFTDEIATNSGTWTLFGTVSLEPHGSTENALVLLASFASFRLYLWYNPQAGQLDRIQFQIYSASGAQVQITPIVPLTQESGDTWRFVFKRTTTGVAVNAWLAGSSPVGADYASTASSFVDGQLAFLGPSQFASRYAGATLNNVLLYDNDVFSNTADYESFAANTAPEKTLTSPGSTTLLWHNTFADGGNLLTYTNASSEVVDAYLVPKPPLVEPSNDDDIRFGGHGVIEIPFYLDFDEYFWTSTNQAARLEWCYQLKLTLPEILAPSTVFEFQDLIRLGVSAVGNTYFFKAHYNNSTSNVTSSVPLTAGGTYDVFVARDTSTNYLNVSQVL